MFLDDLEFIIENKTQKIRENCLTHLGKCLIVKPTIIFIILSLRENVQMKHLTTIVPAQHRRDDTPLSGPWQQIMGGLPMTCKI